MTRFGIQKLRAYYRDAVKQEGLRPLSKKLGIPISILRGAVEDRNLTSDSIEILCKGNGFSFFVGPPRELSPVTKGALVKAIELVEQGLQANSSELVPAKKAELIFTVAEFLDGDADDVAATTVGNIIRLAS